VSLFAELKRRNVFRVGIAYLVASWVLMQIVDVITPIFELPDWAPKFIFVLLAVGLVPALIFAWAFEMTPEGLKKESEVDRTSSIVNQTGRKLNYAITGFLVLAVVLLLAERQMGPPAEVEALPEALAEAPPEAVLLEKSIAVLPFVNMSSDTEQEFFSDGITEEILNSLASVKELKVAGRTSSFAFKGQNDDLRRIGDSLGVAHILEGSVRKAGAQVRITAQLIQVDNGFHLWSETYDRELTDVFAIQDEIANEILKQLKAKLLDGDILVAESKRTSPEVYELYLQAKQRIYTRRRAEIETAVDELDKAIQLDESYAPAFAQRGIATLLLTDEQYGDIPHDESRRRGKRYLDEALRLDPNLAEAWAGMGLYYDDDNDAAIDVLVKALEINPNLIDASNWLQIALRQSGQMKSALEIVTEIAERDPLYRPAFSNSIMLFNAFGQPDKAQALVERIEEFNPDNPDLHMARGINYMYSGRAGEGLREMEEYTSRTTASGVAKFFVSIGLLNTGQAERAVEEGSIFWRPDALYTVGRVDEAIELAYQHARAGSPESLFFMLVREGRAKEMIDYLEERWPSLAAFAAENPGSDGGYSVMHDIALAYRAVGNRARADDALQLSQQRLDLLIEEGVNHIGLSMNMAAQQSLLGNVDTAFEYLDEAVDEGASSATDPYKTAPEFEALFDDPRFPGVRARMLANFNANREVLKLPPYDDNYQVMAE
jgi:TolB-like protein/tetratricopeptide (TPR) repeat protein